MKKIAIIGIVGLPANYGGFEQFTEQLVQRLWDCFDLTVYCQKSAFQTHPPMLGKVHLKYLPLKANGVLSVPYDMLAILDALFHADTLLILGVGGCPLITFLRLFGCRKKVICNIDGLEWRRAKWSKLAQWYLRFAEWCAVKSCNSVIGDNQVIVDYVKKQYNRPCELIEYGADDKPLESK